MSTVAQTIKPGRIIVRQEGVGLSMLRNVKNNRTQNKCERNHQYFKQIFVTFLNKNSVLCTELDSRSKIPSKPASAYPLVEHLWKTGKTPVETLWNE
ncbi:hypothetical protein CLI64_16395 [Nostoc sp. CENA543]|uniref:hypothetical protein n=1 Tax=Nostoc sp. CENA543 TaxID=1869241 RepID=UPI000CA126BF|nr:hypothetical protein [Nostoc sp. CENA543]AUT01837.1 hypothetical protein CLI64_16395 [Nostoc sp. CENA543]